LLEKLGAPAYKIASFEIIDLPLIKLCASTAKPLVISTGMASEDEIAEAVDVARASGAGGVALLHCTSGYPTPFSDADLATIPYMAARYGVPVGLSDHTDGISSPIAAVALGAVLIEKHVTDRRAEGGPDAAFSLEPEEFAAMAVGCRNAYAAIGRIRKERAPSEELSAKFRRSLYVVADMQAGDVFSPSNLRSIRPGLGLPPKYLPEIMGRRARHSLKRGTALAWQDVEDQPDKSDS
jgi:N-acetylneuraminate synthase